MLRHVYSFFLALQNPVNTRRTGNGDSDHDLRFHKQLYLRIDFKNQFLEAEIFSFASQNYNVRNDRAKTRI